MLKIKWCYVPKNSFRIGMLKDKKLMKKKENDIITLCNNPQHQFMKEKPAEKRKIQQVFY